MAQFLTDSEETDSNRDDISTDVSEVESEAGSEGWEAAFEKWRKHSSAEVSEDDNDNQFRGLRSKKDRMIDDIGTLCDSIDFELSVGETYAEANSYFDKLIVKLQEFVNRFHYPPNQFLQTLQMLKELIADKQEEMNESDDYLVKKQFQILAKKTADRCKEFKDQLENLGNENDNDNDDSGEGASGRVEKRAEDWSEEDIAQVVHSLASKVKGRTAIAEKIMRTADEKGFKHFVVAGAGLVCQYALAEDSNPNYVSTKTWRRAYDGAVHAFSVATGNGIHVADQADEEFKFSEKRSFVPGGFWSLATRLKLEVLRACQFVDFATTEYLQRLRDESAAVEFLDRVLQFYLAKGTKRAISRLSLALMECLSPRSQAAHTSLLALGASSAVAGLTSAAAAASSSSTSRVVGADVRTTMVKLHTYVQDSTTEAEITYRATLNLVYHLALHDDFHAARDLMLRSRVQDNYATVKSDIFRVLYNRTIAQLGLCAFRVGLHAETATILSELCGRHSREVRELIGQRDMSRTHMHGYSEEKEIEDRARLLPPHHHLSGQLLDIVFLIVSMLNDLIAEAKNPFDHGQRSKQFANLSRRCSGMALRGAPADDHDAVFETYAAIVDGDISRACSCISGLDVWQFLGESKERSVGLLCARVQADALKVFLINYGSDYASITVSHLAQKFQMSKDDIHAIVSRMLLEHSIVGSWDSTEECVTVERGPHSKIHHLAKESAERIAHFASFNDSMGGGGGGPAQQRGEGGRGGRGGAYWGSTTTGRGGGMRGRGRGGGN